MIKKFFKLLSVISCFLLSTQLDARDVVIPDNLLVQVMMEKKVQAFFHTPTVRLSTRNLSAKPAVGALSPQILLVNPECGEDKDAFQFDKVDWQSANRGIAHFKYPPEGMAGEAHFTIEKGAVVLNSLKVWEH